MQRLFSVDIPNETQKEPDIEGSRRTRIYVGPPQQRSASLFHLKEGDYETGARGWTTPLVLPAHLGQRRAESLESARRNATLVASVLPLIPPKKRRMVGGLDLREEDDENHTTSTTTTTRARKLTDSVNSAVLFAAGRVPGHGELWHPLGRTQPSYEVPSLRKATVRLGQELERALSVLEDDSEPISPLPDIDEESVSYNNGDGDEGTPPEEALQFQGDLMAIKSGIGDEFDRLFRNVKGVADKSDGFQLAAQRLPGCNQNWHTALLDDLAAGAYEAKHLDLAAGALAGQVGVTSVDQGQLLMRLRHGHASSAARLAATNRGLLDRLDEALGALSEAEKQLSVVDRQRGEAEAKAAADHALVCEGLEKAVLARDETLVEERAARVRETSKHESALKTLQALYTDLKEDSGAKVGR